jgi:hypothetical protein
MIVPAGVKVHLALHRHAQGLRRVGRAGAGAAQEGGIFGTLVRVPGGGRRARWRSCSGTATDSVCSPSASTRGIRPVANSRTRRRRNAAADADRKHRLSGAHLEAQPLALKISTSIRRLPRRITSWRRRLRYLRMRNRNAGRCPNICHARRLFSTSIAKAARAVAARCMRSARASTRCWIGCRRSCASCASFARNLFAATASLGHRRRSCQSAAGLPRMVRIIEDLADDWHRLDERI